MSANFQAEAVLLLTAHLRRPAKDDPKPLGPSEWGRFARWLRDRGMVPELLLQEDPATVLAGWVDRSITVDRIRYLLGRAGALGLAMERWERAGLWVVTRSDRDYPCRLKKRLGMDSPPFLFGCGSRNLLGQGGIAIVGSRDATEEDLAFTSRLGAQATLERLPVVSGGARGVDEAAMLGALELEGTVVGILSDNLLRAATSSKYRKALMAGRLVLASPFNPDAGFDVGNAMARNKYIYCLADAAIVIATAAGKGGTWSGATENLRNGWVPLWVKPSQDEGSGNSTLVKQGANWLPDADLRLSSLSIAAAVQRSGEQVGLFDVETPHASEFSVPPTSPSYVVDVPREYRTKAQPGEPNTNGLEVPDGLDLYPLFLTRLERLTANKPATTEQLVEALGLHRSQLNDWLNRALGEGRVRKLSKPVRYVWVAGPPSQVSLFDPNEH